MELDVPAIVGAVIFFGGLAVIGIIYGLNKMRNK